MVDIESKFAGGLFCFKCLEIAQRTDAQTKKLIFMVRRAQRIDQNSIKQSLKHSNYCSAFHEANCNESFVLDSQENRL